MDEPSRQTAISIGVTATLVTRELSLGCKRKIIIVTNVSTAGQVVSLGIGEDAVSKSGIVLYPGAMYSETLDATFTPTTAKITAIADVAGASLALYERTD